MNSKLTMLLLIGVLACTDTQVQQALVIADSAGVSIVTNQIQPAAVPEVSPVELLLEIGTVDGAPEEQLYFVSDGLRLDDGRVAILNAGTQQLRFYDAQGRFLASQGRAGDGPGEYHLPFTLLPLPGDSLLVYDIGGARFTVVGPSGEAVRAFTLSRTMVNEPVFAGLIGDSVAVLHELLYNFTTAGFNTMDRRVAFIEMDGSGAEELMLAGPRMGPFGPQGRGMVGMPFFEPDVFPAACNGALCAGSGWSPEVAVYDASGRLQRLVRWNADPIRVSSQDVALEIERKVANQGNRAEELRRWYSEVPVPESFPIYDEIQSDRQGRLWVRQYEKTDTAAREWLVFAPGGQLLQRVTLPSGLRVLDVDEHHLLGVQTDELDVEYVQLWRLSKVSGPK